MPRIFASIPCKAGAEDSVAELAAAAAKIDGSTPPIAIVAGWGSALDALCTTAAAFFPDVWKITNESLSYPNSEIVRKVVAAVVPPGSIVLLTHDHFGIDLAPGLSIKLNAAYLPDAVDIESVKANVLKAVRQEYGGQFSAHVSCDISAGAVISTRPGAFKPTPLAPVNGKIVDKTCSIDMSSVRRRYLDTVIAESGDVDITKHAVLVSIGRGIQDPENIGIADELAEALGAAVSCSRPVVDAKWLPKSRQVGSSGKTVKPKVYLACGISGAFQHLAGLKGNPFIIAINKNPKAPIFQVADVGVVADLLEFLPELTAKIKEVKRVSV
jgi:electron transfer flavoprotein alpha subunit